nr:rRNA maturation RNase YbeY [Sneathiella sp. P13V-1]
MTKGEAAKPDCDISGENTHRLPLPCDLIQSFEAENWPLDEDDLKNLADRLFNLALASVLNEEVELEIPEATSLEISLLYTDDGHIQELNRDFRGKDKPTNVLSFPDTPLSNEALAQSAAWQEPLFLGDIAIAKETLIREAEEQSKSFEDHLSHLLLHGILHLVGYDHIEDDEAEEMEALEIKLLAKMGIDNPYQSGDS